MRKNPTKRGARHRQNYGYLWINKKQVLAHRFSFQIHNGSLDPKKSICHSCDNPPCVNPLHLWAGSQIENNRDAISKKRHAFGEKAWSAKLTDEQVLLIREKSIPGKHGNHAELAKEFGISPKTIPNIVSKRAWKHL